MTQKDTASLLDDLIAHAKGRPTVTIAELIGQLGDASFGLVTLVFGMLGAVPGLSIAAGFALIVLAAQMTIGRDTPRFPGLLTRRAVSGDRLARVVARFMPVLRVVERPIRQRLPSLYGAGRRAVGPVTIVLGAAMMLPFPLSNIPPALVVVLIALAWLGRDGVALAIGLVAALALFAAMGGMVWEAVLVSHRL